MYKLECGLSNYEPLGLWLGQVGPRCEQDQYPRGFVNVFVMGLNLVEEWERDRRTRMEGNRVQVLAS